MDNKSKIYQLLSSLNFLEIKMVKSTLKGGPHTYPSEAIQLFQLLEKKLQQKQDFPTNEELIKAIKTTKKLNDQDIRIYKSYIVKIIENQLVQQEVSESSSLYQLLLSRAYLKKDNLKFSQKEITAGIQMLHEDPVQNAQNYLEKYQFALELYKIHKNGQREEFSFNDIFTNLDTYYLSERLRLLTLLQNYKKILGVQYTDTAVEPIMAYLKTQPPLLDVPSIKIYYNIYQILKDENNEVLFDQMLEYIKAHSEVFPKEELKDILLNLNNFCIRKINTGDQDYLQKSFSIYQLGIASSSLLEKGYLSRYTFKNIVTLGIRLQNYEWTDQFIEDNFSLIEKQYQESSYAYNKAYLEYAMKNYDSAISLLQKSDGDDVLLSLSARNLLKKIYFEKDYLDPLEYLLGSTSAYLRRKDPEKVYKENYTNINLALRKLIQLKKLTSSQKISLEDKKQKARQFFDTLTPLSEKKWLLEQLALII